MSNTTKQDTTARAQIPMPEALWRRVKAQAALEGETVQGWVCHVLENALQKGRRNAAA